MSCLFVVYLKSCFSLHVFLKQHDRQTESQRFNPPYTHTGLYVDRRPFRARFLLLNSCRVHRSPPASDQMTPCHTSHSGDLRPQPCTRTVPPPAHRTGWENPAGRRHRGRSRPGGTSSNNQSRSGRKKDLNWRNRRDGIERWAGKKMNEKRWCFAAFCWIVNLSLTAIIQCVRVCLCARAGERVGVSVWVCVSE